MDSFVFPALPDGVPSGRYVTARRSEGRAVLWVTGLRERRAGALWARLYALHARTGLYPLLLDALDSSPRAVLQGECRPWHHDDLRFVPVEKIDALDPDDVLRGMWPDYGDDYPDPREMPSRWPGLAVPSTCDTDPGLAAGNLARRLAGASDRLLGLVPAARGADALSLSGWRGPINHTNFTEEISAVVRSWEQRFGVRVIKVGWDTLDLSVAAPPANRDHALQVAAEHRAFCPDNFSHASLESYAAWLVGRDHWSFWWD
ncbi:DUF4253 domain-containing protein [Nocardia huaxiensis]|nr:DUF4253 domain-containing protein [Nocardia huaxiensis]